VDDSINARPAVRKLSHDKTPKVKVENGEAGLATRWTRGGWGGGGEGGPPIKLLKTLLLLSSTDSVALEKITKYWKTLKKGVKSRQGERCETLRVQGCCQTIG